VASVPAGTVTLRLERRLPPVVVAGMAISLLALLVLVGRRPEAGRRMQLHEPAASLSGE
jgi:hypothetical protein